MTHRHAVAEAAPIHLGTGRIELRLSNEQGRENGITLEVQIRMEVAVVWHGSRTLGIADRDQLAAWLRRPADPFGFDDIMLDDDHGALLVVFDGGRPLYAEPDSVAGLRAMLGTCGG